jgi:hypothetical protein
MTWIGNGVSSQTLHVPHVCGHASEAPSLLQRFRFFFTHLQPKKRTLPLIRTLNFNVESEQFEAVGAGDVTWAVGGEDLTGAGDNNGDAFGATVGDLIGAEDTGDAVGATAGFAVGMSYSSSVLPNLWTSQQIPSSSGIGLLS